MKLTDKIKKRLTVAGLGVVCVVLVMAIATQFKTEVPKNAIAPPSPSLSDSITPSTLSEDPNTMPEVNAQTIDPAVDSPQTTDTGDSEGTEQSLQAEVAKPVEPPQEELTDKTKKPESTAPPSAPQSGDKQDGKIYVPGFGWIEDNGGGGSGTTAEDMYENGNKIGNMD